MISRKKLVRIGVLPLALAFVRPGYSYKGPAPSTTPALSLAIRRSAPRSQSAPPDRATNACNVPKGFEVGAGVAACGRGNVAHIKSPVPSLRQLILGARRREENARLVRNSSSPRTDIWFLCRANSADRACRDFGPSINTDQSRVIPAVDGRLASSANTTLHRHNRLRARAKNVWLAVMAASLRRSPRPVIHRPCLGPVKGGYRRVLAYGFLAITIAIGASGIGESCGRAGARNSSMLLASRGPSTAISSARKADASARAASRLLVSAAGFTRTNTPTSPALAPLRVTLICHSAVPRTQHALAKSVITSSISGSRLFQDAAICWAGKGSNADRMCPIASEVRRLDDAFWPVVVRLSTSAVGGLIPMCISVISSDGQPNTDRGRTERLPTSFADNAEIIELAKFRWLLSAFSAQVTSMPKRSGPSPYRSSRRSSAVMCARVRACLISTPSRLASPSALYDRSHTVLPECFPRAAPINFCCSTVNSRGAIAARSLALSRFSSPTNSPLASLSAFRTTADLESMPSSPATPSATSTPPTSPQDKSHRLGLSGERIVPRRYSLRAWKYSLITTPTSTTTPITTRVTQNVSQESSESERISRAFIALSRADASMDHLGTKMLLAITVLSAVRVIVWALRKCAKRSFYPFDRRSLHWNVCRE
jgi:hypothetical protein